MKQTELLRKMGIFITLMGLMQSATLANNTFPLTHTTEELSAAENRELINYADYIVDELLLPRHIYALSGNAVSSERYTIFYRNALLSLAPNYLLSTYSPYGLTTTGRWLYKTPTDLLPPVATPFPLSMLARTNSGTISADTTVELVDTTNDTPIRLLALGDSLTRAGVYLSQINSKLTNVTFLGTRSYPTDGIPVREGRGGWTLEKYVTSINSVELDSPFVFPKDIDGARYKGNTRDWQKICYEKPNMSAYNGFQKLARGWQDEGEFLYNEEGYYKYPTVGDVMVDPSLPSGAQWIEWNGYYWQTMAVQPTEFEFNFSKYMTRNQAAFTNGTPTHISILLGANDFGFQKEIDQIDLFIERLNTVIDSIHTFDPSIKIILCLPTVGPNVEQITSSNQDFYTEYNLCVKYASSQLLKAFDTDEALARQIYLAPTHLTLDPALGFDYIEKDETIDGITKKVVDVKNSIHPNNTVGQLLMGDTIAAVLQKTR